ncbi:unnamed protein product [Rotaria sordida]|uniref:LITAF domain-containing protein n=1 Tax=Rotaria sordida TaxID=392033 RepID=A0A819UYV9_9BILA|nr:unnamed protein product [Rotaria sordida]
MQQTSIYELPFNNYYEQLTNSGEYQQVQYADNMNMNLQSQPIYQTPFQQPPPSYPTAVQPLSYPIPTQQQPPPVYNNQNLSTKYLTGPGVFPPKQYKWPRRSIALVCPRCGATVTTRVETEITFITFIGCLILCVFICFLGWLALLLPACKKVIHYCPYCNSILGVRPELR